MPTLAEHLVKKVEERLLDLEGQDPVKARKEIRDNWNGLLGMRASGLRLFEIASEDFQDIAAIIEKDHKDKLNPWVTVYSAAFGMDGVLNRIIWTWATTPPPSGTDKFNEQVRNQIDTLVPGYANLIAREP
jgi:hypothetical protein